MARTLSQSQSCVFKEKPVIRAVTVFDSFFTVEVEAELSELGNTVCIGGSVPCRKVVEESTNNPNGSPQRWTVTCCAGYLVDIGKQIFDHLGYDWTLYVTPDNLYGSFANSACFGDTDGVTNHTECEWNGMVNELIKGRADVALGALTPTSQRVRVVDFATENIIITHLVVAYRYKPEELHFVNWKFLQSLDWTLLVSLQVTLIVVCCALFIVEYFLRRMKSRGKHSEGSSSIGKYPTREAFSYGAGLTFQRDLAGKTPDRWSARIIAISYAVALTIIMTTYTANLTATNISKAQSDFKGLKDAKVCYC